MDKPGFHNKPKHLRLVEQSPEATEEIKQDLGEKALADNVFPFGLKLRSPPELGWERPDDAA